MDRLGLRQVRELCLVVDLSAKSRHVRPLSVGLVWSGRRQSPWVRAVEFDTDQTLLETWSQARTCLVESGRLHVVEFINDTTRPDQRQRLVEPVSNSTTWTRNGPDRTRPDQPGSPIKSNRGPPSRTWTYVCIISCRSTSACVLTNGFL